MSEADPTREGHHESGHYEIRIKGHLDARWAEWFEGMDFGHASDGTTTLSGPMIDQAALFGLLKKVRDLGLPLVAVIHVDPRQSDEPTVNP